MKDKAYYEDVNIKNELKLRDMIQKLPKFCMDFFIGIDADKSSRTKIAYAYDLQTFFEYMKSANPSLKKYDIRDYPISLLDQISPSDIEEYLFYLKYYEKDGVVHTNDERGIKRKLASLRTFYNFYFRKEFIDTNPASKVTLPKIHEKNIIRLDTDEVAQLLDEVESGDSLSKNQQRFHEKTKVRDLALMTLLLGTGIRVSECVGLDMDDETDELTPLSEYAARAIERANNGKPKDNIMCVIDEACSACVQINYEITDLCRGCTARSCQYNCPKGAVHVHADTGKAWIDHDTCISCGICHKSCPYHAIVYIPVPCEESCPVKAISKDEHGIEHIDENKCIYCGKCMNACPFGAIFEISQTFDVLQRIRKGEQVVAIVAPSILGQFSTTIEQVYGAFRQIGFTDIIEVAQGAMSTVEHEAHELIEKLEEGQKFMTTSCCPSYIELVNKYIPDMKKYVSGTGSPMYYAARIAKEKYPDAKIVFVGPCVAKRKEAQRDEAVDFVMTFEEISSIFDAFEINLEIVQPYAMEFSSVREAHGFAQAGGVMGAVKAFLKMEADKINAIQVSDLNKKNIGTLRAYAKSGKAPGQFIEVMACEGGCITGPSTHSGSNNGKRQLVQELAKQKKTY